MAKTIINDTNLEITNFKINKQNELEKLQINGNEVSLGEEPALEDNKESTISSNGTFEIEPSTGYDGMKKVTATVNVSSDNVLYCYASQDAAAAFPYLYFGKDFSDITTGDRAIIYDSSNSRLAIASNVYATTKTSDTVTVKVIGLDVTYTRSASNDIDLANLQ